MSRAPYIDSGDARLCTGCSACAFACPTGAISMGEDACGFTYPVVDEGACVSCGRCLSSCHMARSDEFKAGSDPAAFGAYDKDADALRRSASGGIATLLCASAVNVGGAAYGCVAHRELVRHERLVTRDELELARGSKYVQSDISDALAGIAADLDSGKEVAFVGTPCQCAAVRALFGGRSDLLLVDLVCEGVPSRRMYADFLDDLERERGERVSDFRFRDKRGGWSTKNPFVVGGGGEHLGRQPHSHRYCYYWLFAHALILRDCCYECPYACRRRVGDVTVGDFWGAEASGLGYGLRELRGGVSCVLASTEKGRRALESLSDNIDVRACDPGVVVRGNSCLARPSTCDRETRARVLSAYADGGAAGMSSEYRRMFAFAARVKAAVSARLPLAFKVAAKRAMSKLKGSNG